MHNGTAKVGAAVVVGGAVGATLALLYAPQSDRRTRKDIAEYRLFVHVRRLLLVIVVCPAEDYGNPVSGPIPLFPGQGQLRPPQPRSHDRHGHDVAGLKVVPALA